jgi:uncharacterized protein
VEEAKVARRPIEREDLVGTLFSPDESGRHPVVLVLGGSEGGLIEGGARALASQGFAALALAYFGVEPLSGELVEVPLEYFAKALDWLKSQPAVDSDRIAVIGDSKGGELALLLGATYPQDLKTVVGYVPSAIVWQGISFDPRVFSQGPKSSWTLEGEPLPFVEFAQPRYSEMLEGADSFFGKPVAFRPFYEGALDDEEAVAAASIAVEKIGGPVLLISGTDDQLWPSTRLCEMAIERLKANHFPFRFRYEHLRYEGAGHLILVPGMGPDPSEIKRFALGGSTQANEAASADSWPKVLNFLREALG